MSSASAPGPAPHAHPCTLLGVARLLLMQRQQQGAGAAGTQAPPQLGAAAPAWDRLMQAHGGACPAPAPGSSQ